MKTKMAFQIRAEASRRLELDLYDVIGADPLFGGGISAGSILGEVKARPNASEILVRINSAGGVVTEGLAVYNLLKQSKARVTCRVDALAGSIASVIAMAGSVIEMAQASLMMVHEPWGLTQGPAGDHQATAATLGSMRELMVNIYVARTGQPENKIKRMMADETWMTAREALALGFCDRIVEDSGTQIAACVDLTEYKHVPKGLNMNTLPPLSPEEVKVCRLMQMPEARYAEAKARDIAAGKYATRAPVLPKPSRAQVREVLPHLPDSEIDAVLATYDNPGGNAA